MIDRRTPRAPYVAPTHVATIRSGGTCVQNARVETLRGFIVEQVGGDVRFQIEGGNIIRLRASQVTTL